PTLAPGSIPEAYSTVVPPSFEENRMKRVLALPSPAGALTAAPAAAQAPAAAPAPEQHFMPVGSMAPDITLTGATRYGVIQASIKLSEFRGEPVVFAFFCRPGPGG